MRTSSIIETIRAQFAIDSPPKSVADLINPCFRHIDDDLDRIEQIQKRVPGVINQLIAIHSEMRQKETECWFEFNSAAGDFIQGPYFSEPADTNETRTAKSNRLRSAQFKQALQSLTFSQFEDVCKAVLLELGVREAKETKRSKDHGIDFFGRLAVADIESSTIPFFRLTHRLKFWLIGQAKHYSGGKVSAPEIRDLVGSINLARFKEYATVTLLLKDLELRSCDPVFALFMTTGRFSADATRLAENSGVVLLDLQALATYLADKDIQLAGQSADEMSASLAAWATARCQLPAP